MIENESSKKLQKYTLFNGAHENSPDASIFLAARAATQDAYCNALLMASLKVLIQFFVEFI